MPRKYTFPSSEEVNRKARVHHRLRKLRGPASSWCCSDCSNAGRDWSHIHDTDDEDIDNYVPRCRKCHAKYDNAGSKPCDPKCVCDRHFNSGPKRKATMGVLQCQG